MSAGLDDLLAGYVLGVLSPAEAAVVDGALMASPSLRAEVEVLTEALVCGVVAPLPAVTPAPGARARLMSALG